MNEDTLATVLAPALADALVRFVWQGAAIGVLAWSALALLRNARPQARAMCGNRSVSRQSACRVRP